VHRGTTTRAGGAVAQFDAYRATHDRRFLADACTLPADHQLGWDPVAGGIWWNGPARVQGERGLAGGTLTAAGLYEGRTSRGILALARKYIAWADRTIRAPDRLYGARVEPEAPDALRRGADAEAFLRCAAHRSGAYCHKGEHLLRVPPPTSDLTRARRSTRSTSDPAARLPDGTSPRWYRIAAAIGATKR
jgi:hypothetical protein